MTLTRWKLLAGVFGISVCGFAALAEPACRSVGTANRQEPTVPDAKPKGSNDAKPKATAPVVDVAPAELPAATAPVSEIIPLIAPVEPKPAVGVTTPAEVPTSVPPVPVALAPAPPGSTFSGALVTPEQFAKDLIPPAAVTTAKVAALPGADIATPPAVPPAPPQILTPTPTPTPLPPTAEMPPIRQVEASRPSAPTSDKKLKVTLQMDEGNPKFEVRDGDEVVLKVTSNKVDVASAMQDRGATLKACGQVKFAMPGGDGSCDTLQVMPGTGEITAVGNVTFRYNWGKVETSASAEKMNFRLGTLPLTR